MSAYPYSPAVYLAADIRRYASLHIADISMCKSRHYNDTPESIEGWTRAYRDITAELAAIAERLTGREILMAVDMARFHLDTGAYLPTVADVAATL